MITSNEKWEWGKEWTPKSNWVSPFEAEPKIEGTVKWISDIRNAPAGEKWKFLESKYTECNLLVRVLACASDKFTLYVEGSIEKTGNEFQGGIHLDASSREAEEVLSNYVLKFCFPERNFIYIPTLQHPLLAAAECPLIETPINLPVNLIAVNERQEKEDHKYFILGGNFKKGKICLSVQHTFSVIAFTFEYKADLKSDDCGATLLCELFAIEDHSKTGCSCSRKGIITSIVKIKLARISNSLPNWLHVWGPHDSQFVGEPELGISTDPNLQDW